MSLSDEIRAKQKAAKCDASRSAFQWVLDNLSERGRLAGSKAKDKVRGDSKYYSKLAGKRWKK